MPTYKDTERGTWFASFYYTDFTGKRHKTKKRGFKTQREAKEYERQFLLKSQNSPDMTFASLWQLYCSDIEDRVRFSTKQTKLNNVETHILPYFKNRVVAEIKAADVRNWQNAMLKKRNPKTGNPYAPTYLRSVNSQLSAILNYAVRFQNLSSNPCHSVKAIGKKKSSMDFWTLDQFNAVIAHEKQPAYHVAFMLLFWCGMRSGELLALTRKKILPNHSLDIYQTFKHENGEDVFTTTKSDNGIRQIPLPDFLYEELMTYINSLYSLCDEDRIFYFKRSSLNKELDRIATQAGIPRIRVHDLRHSHVSMLVELGYSSHDIAARIGDTAAEVDKTYAHLYPDKGERMARELERHKDGFAQ
jgi:integrase